MKPICLLGLVTLMLLAADNAGDAAKKEYERFEGTWRIASLELDGMKVDAVTFKDVKLILKGKDFTYVDPASTTKGTYLVDVSKKPKTIDITFNDGPEKGKTVLGIYELEGDTYKVCLNVNGKVRPNEFGAKAGTGSALEILKREKP